jgi:5-methyltetrahydrofolate--homocysteine methyltransferase
VTYDEVYAAYRQQAIALHKGGVDIFLVETIFDTLNAKAALKAILDLADDGLEPLPIWVSGTITDRSGRTLSGQTVEAFWNSIRHAKPFAFGGYDEQPEETGGHLGEWARSGLVNIVGGCCGTTPAHIQAIAEAVQGLPPRKPEKRPMALRLAGLEPFELAV